MLTQSTLPIKCDWFQNRFLTHLSVSNVNVHLQRPFHVCPTDLYTKSKIIPRFSPASFMHFHPTTFLLVAWTLYLYQQLVWSALSNIHFCMRDQVFRWTLRNRICLMGCPSIVLHVTLTGCIGRPITFW